MEIGTALIGKPMLWNTATYGKVAVHVKGISANGRVAVLTIDGGEASKQAQMFPELSDGIGYAVLGNLSKRTPVARKPRGKAGMIRSQAEIGKTETNKLPILPTAEEVHDLQDPKQAVALVKPAGTVRKSRSRKVTNPVGDAMTAAGIVVF